MRSPATSGAPALDLHPNVGQVLELAALEEALPDVGDAPLHLGLVFWVAGSGRVDNEAPALGVFQEAPGEDGMQRVRRGHRGREVVDDQVLGNAAEEGPGRLQAGDDILQLLVEGGPDETVPGVAQHQDQRPYRAAAAGLGVLDQAQAAEVHLRHLTRRRLFHPHRGLGSPSPVAAGHEALQGGIRYPAIPLPQQLLDAGQLQPVAGEPPVDLVGPRGQQILAGCRCLPGPRLSQGRQPAQLFLAGLSSFRGYAQGCSRSDVSGHRVPGQPRPRGDASLAVSRPPAADDFQYVHSEYLLIGHICTSH